MTQEDLHQAISDQIIPCILTVRTGDIWGTAFFAHPNWLVGNAHVFTTHNSIDQAEWHTHSGPIDMSVLEKFIRPPESITTPDIVVANMSHDIPDISKALLSLPSEYTKIASLDSQLDDAEQQNYEPESVIFTIDTTPTVTGHFRPCVLKEVTCDTMSQHEHSGIADTFDGVPMVFEPEIPGSLKYGMSGAPVLKAFRDAIHHPWQFSLIGVLYARCQFVASKPPLACVVPLEFDLEQIRQIKIEQDSAKNSYSKLLSHMGVFHDKDAEIINQQLKNDVSHAKQAVKDQWRAYEEGVSPLYINAPDHIEKLLGKYIKIEYSALSSTCAFFTKNAIKAFKKNSSIENLFGVENEVLHQSFEKCLHDLGAIPQVDIKKSGKVDLDNEYFRIDMAGANKDTMIKFSLQDNIKGDQLRNVDNGSYAQKQYKKSVEKKPYSSVFAEVRVNNSLKKIEGSMLAEALLKAYEIPGSVDLPLSDCQPGQCTDKSSREQKNSGLKQQNVKKNRR